MPTIAEQILIDSCVTGFACTAQNDLSFRQSFLELLYQIQQGGGGGGGGTPGGPLNAVQFNSPLGTFAGSADLTFDDATNILALAGSQTIATGANTTPLSITGYSLTGANAQSGVSLTGTWNTTGAPSALMVSITDTASDAASYLLDLRVGGVVQGRMDKFGGMASDLYGARALSVYTTQAAAIATDLTNRIMRLGLIGFHISSDVHIGWSANPAAGGDANAAIDVSLIRNAAGVIEVNNGTTGTFRDLYARTLRVATAFTVATLPVAGTAGRIAYVTDSLAPAFLAIAVGGGAIITTVLDNGTNWVTV